MTENPTAFDGAEDWVDVHLALSLPAPHRNMLRRAREEKCALHFIDGLDEAGALRARIEQHFAKVLAPQGHAMLCTSRPTGLDKELLSLLIGLLENGVNPEALAAIVKELRQEPSCKGQAARLAAQRAKL